MNNVRAKGLLLALGLGMGAMVFGEDPPVLWKDYDSAFLGVQLRVKRDWTEIEMKETKETGSLAFVLRATDPPSRVYAMRQKINESFQLWTSSETLSQVFQPGYKRSGPVMFAGRSSIKVIGIPLGDQEGRTEETYYSSKPPFLDQISFAAPQAQWAMVEPDFSTVRKSIRWTR